jgi:hypothetical protein
MDKYLFWEIAKELELSGSAQRESLAIRWIEKLNKKEWKNHCKYCEVLRSWGAAPSLTSEIFCSCSQEDRLACAGRPSDQQPLLSWTAPSCFTGFGKKTPKGMKTFPANQVGPVHQGKNKLFSS